MKERKILFVCHGNICRSPLAEFLLKKEAAARGRENEITVSSAGVSDEEHGGDIYPPVQRLMREHNVPFEHRHARVVSAKDYGAYDRVLCMEERNAAQVKSITGGDPEGKIGLLGDCAGIGDIDDPWYSRDFETTYRQIETCVKNLAKTLFQ